MDELPPKDHLTELPPELLHEIISYLFATHDPDKAFQTDALLCAKYRTLRPGRHDLDRLAGTSKIFHNEVMEWARIFLRMHKDVTKFNALARRRKPSKPQTEWLRGHGGLLQWAGRNCVFCGKTSSRAAIFMNGLNCCKNCDEVQWPDKITKTTAREEYHHTDHHLLPHQQHTPISAKMLAKHPGGLPTLRYGTCMTINTPATFFLRKDVEALAGLLHGDLKAHLAQRKLDREERSRKVKATREEKEAQERQKARRLDAAARPAIASAAGNSAARPIVLADEDMLTTAGTDDYLPAISEQDYLEDFRESL